MKKWIYAFVISFCLNVFILLPYVGDIIQKIHPVQYWDSTSKDEDVLNSIISYALDNNCSSMIKDEHRGIFIDIPSYYFKPRRLSHIKNNFNESYYYAGLSYYALRYRDNTLISFLLKKANEFIDNRTKELNYPIKVCDQYPIGIFFINLYKITGDSKFKEIYTKLYKSLISYRDANDIITYRENSKLHYVDELGMYVPFLMEYYSISKDSLALTIVNKNIIAYKEYGIDDATHIPYHGYEKNKKIKLGSANWGRGIGWYLLALAYCPQERDSILFSNIEKLPYTQFPLSSKNFDSSTALMFEIYKQSKCPRRKLDLSFIKKYIRKNGLVDSFSGDTYDLNDYSHRSGGSELGNGFLCILASKFAN